VLAERWTVLPLLAFVVGVLLVVVALFVGEPVLFVLFVPSVLADSRLHAAISMESRASNSKMAMIFLCMLPSPFD